MDIFSDFFLDIYRWAIFYNINPYFFIVIYIFSIIPVYLGIFLIIYGSMKEISLGDILKLKFNNLKFDKKVIIGIGLWFIGLIMPYVYILLWGRNLSSLSYVAILLIIIVSILYILFQLKKSHYSASIKDNNAIIFKKEIISSDIEKEVLWKIYDDSFIELNKNAPCKQSFDKEHFMDILVSPTAIKYIIENKDNKIIGMGIVTNDFKNTPWISEEYFKNKFKSYYDRKLIYYFMGIAILRGYRHKGFASMLIRIITEELPLDSILGFDNSANMNFFIPNFVKIVNRGKKVKKEYLDSQNYYIISQK